MLPQPGLCRVRAAPSQNYKSIVAATNRSETDKNTDKRRNLVKLGAHMQLLLVAKPWTDML